MGLKLSNNAISRLGSALSAGATSISVASGEGAKFPSLGAGDYFPATLSKPDGSYEIVNVTARSGDTLTAVRAREGTTALSFDANTLIELRLTALTIETITAKLDGIAVGATNVTDTSQLTNGAGYVTSSGSVAYATNAGNAGTVTNGVYTTGSYANPSWLTSLDYSKLTGAVPTWNQNTTGNAATATTATSVSGGSVSATTGTFTGALTVGNGATSSDIYMADSDNGTRRIHNNSNQIGFLTQADGWGAYCDDSGNWVASGNVTAYSDERIKKNWRPVSDGFVEKLAQVKSGIYDRTDIEATQAGVSAQSFRALLAEVVNEDKDGNLSLAYGNAALVAAVELAKEIVELRKEIAALKGS